MTADVYPFPRPPEPRGDPHLNEVRGINRVVYDVLEAAGDDRVGVSGAVRIGTAAGAAMLCSSCTFRHLKANQCMRDYGEGMMIAAASARAKGAVVEEAFGYCLDGGARADEIVRSLRAQGFEVNEPKRHFEVPGAWFVRGARPVSQEQFDPMRSLQAACETGHASPRGYMTGASLTASDEAASITCDPAADRKARNDKRLANTTDQ